MSSTLQSGEVAARATHALSPSPTRLLSRIDRRRRRALTPAVGAVLAASMCGALLVSDLPRGLGFAAGLAYLPLVLLQLPAALAVWIGSLFVANLPAVSIAPNAAALLILGAWLTTLRDRRATVNAVLGRHRRLAAAAVALLAWLTLSLMWATDPVLWFETQWTWYVAVTCGLVVATTLTTRHHVRWVLVAFTGGAVISVLIGLLGGGLNQPLPPGAGPATQTEGRLQGGAADPNILAAGLIPAIAFSATLIGMTRRLLPRAILVLAIGVLTAGLAATQSRGGALAAAVAAVAAFVIYKRHRPQMLAVFGVVASCGFLWSAANPGAWERLTSYDDGGAGRADLWQVGWRMAGDHPMTGVGLGNFTARASEYVNQPGGLTYVELIVERPHTLHNLYLGLLAETGVLGLLLFLVVAGACLNAARLAAARFEAIGEPVLASVSRAVMVGALSMLVAGIFISYGADLRLWVTLALGPALLALCSRQRGPALIPRPSVVGKPG